MEFVKPQESIEPPVNTGMEGQSPDMDMDMDMDMDVASAPSPETESEAAANSIGLLLQRVAGISIDEINKLTAELQATRHLLQSEATRIERQIIEYAHLNQSAMQTTKVIADHLASRRTGHDRPSSEDKALQPDPVSQEDSRIPADHPQAAARRGPRPFPVRGHADQARLG
jgi:hypothetical protein